MKKNDCSMLLCLWSKVKRWLFLMKLIAFFFLVGLLQVNAEALGQREMVTFPSDVMVLKNVLGEIQKQLKYDIFYSDEELDVNREVILSSKKMILETALKEVLYCPGTSWNKIYLSTAIRTQTGNRMLKSVWHPEA